MPAISNHPGFGLTGSPMPATWWFAGPTPTTVVGWWPRPRIVLLGAWRGSSGTIGRFWPGTSKALAS